MLQTCGKRWGMVTCVVCEANKQRSALVLRVQPCHWALSQLQFVTDPQPGRRARCVRCAHSWDRAPLRPRIAEPALRRLPAPDRAPGRPDAEWQLGRRLWASLPAPRFEWGGLMGANRALNSSSLSQTAFWTLLVRMRVNASVNIQL